LSGLFQELKRRNVIRVGAAYVVLSWLLAQVAEMAAETFSAPEWVMKMLVTLLALGLPLALFFAWAFELTPEGIKKEKDVDRGQSITHQTGRKLDFTVIAILVLALGYFAFDKFIQSPGQVTTTPLVVEEIVTKPNEKSIAVLPFVNMSNDKSNEYFSDGISEEILNALAKIKQLKVAGRTSSFAFKGKNQDLRQIGAMLGVENILEGSVRKSGTKIRITAQLVQVEDGFHLWSETYDRELTDVFAIQDEIAAAILKQLKAQLIGEELQTIAVTKTNTEAYDLYLLAKQRMYERTGPTIESAAELLDRAIAIDPQYAPAYAQRAIATFLLSEGTGSYGDIPRDQAQAQGKLYLDKALELDPKLAEGWAGLGLYYEQLPMGSKQAIEVLKKALAMNPSLIDASNWLHNAYMAEGRPAEAKQVVMGMIDRDPLYRPGIRNAVNNFINFGQQEQAWAFLDRIRPLVPNDAVIKSSEAILHLSQGRIAEGLALAETAEALLPSNSVIRFTQTLGLLDSQQYEKVVDRVDTWMPVLALTLLGRAEEASIIAFRRAEEQADVGTLFGFLNLTGRSDEVVTYIEARWPDLATLQQDFPPYGAFGYGFMLEVALAYSRAGNQLRFDEAMHRIGKVHEALIEQQVSNSILFMTEAAYQALAGDLDSSMDYLDQAVALGFVTHTPISDFWQTMEPLKGDPRYESIQSRMIEHINRERQTLGLEPVST
jgi:TolB-like protein/Tfp pilus assembly protein PilF